MIKDEILESYGAQKKGYNAGEIIFAEGSKCQYYHQLISGSVKWINITDEGKEYLQMIIDPGESFGELPLFDQGLYAANAIADADCTVYRLSDELFHLLIISLPEIHFAFSKLLAQRLRFKFMIIKEFAFHDPEHRITALLNEFKATRKHICPECFQLKLTRQQIGNMTGLRVETVIRAMRSMHDNGAIQIEKGRVFLRGNSPEGTLKTASLLANFDK